MKKNKKSTVSEYILQVDLSDSFTDKSLQSKSPLRSFWSSFLEKLGRKAVVPEYIWFISLVIVSITIVVYLKNIFTSSTDLLKTTDIKDVAGELVIKRDFLGGLYIEKLKVKPPKNVDNNYFIENLKLYCFEDNKGILEINFTEFNKNFLVEDQQGYLTFTKRIHLAGPDETTVFYYSFDDCEYNKNFTKDLSGNNNHGLIFGNPKCVKGVKGYALEFLGYENRSSNITPIGISSSYIITKDKNILFDMNEFSVIAWVNLKNHDGWDVIVEKVNHLGYNKFMIGFIQGYLVMELNDDDIFEGNVSGNPLADPNTYFIDNASYYINKTLFIGETYTEKGTLYSFVNGYIKSKYYINVTFRDEEGPIVIGADIDSYYPYPTADTFDGMIDELIIYKKALKPYQIRTMYYFNCTEKGAKWYLFIGDYKEGIKIAETEVS